MTLPVIPWVKARRQILSNKLSSYLESQLQTLKLKGILTHYREITEKASQNNLSYPEYLSLLLEEELSSLDFLEKKENVIFLGPPGVGKTHLSVALGIKACMAKYRVVFITAQKLLEELMLSLRDGSLTDKLLSYSRLNLLIIDELGYMPVSKEQANLLFRLVSMRYERGSIIITSNYNFNEWGEVFSDQVVAAAIIGRLVHHDGSSISMEQATGSKAS